MAVLLQVALTLMVAVAGYCCFAFDESNDGLANIIHDCEWISKQNMISDILLDRYRKYAMYNFFLLDDVCAVYEWNKNLKDPEYNENNEVEYKSSSSARIHQEQIPDVTNDQQTTALNHPINSNCTKSAKDFFICLSNQLADPTLDAMILDNLEVTCDPRYPSTPAQKRNSKYVSKQKFYSWGGKRNNANVFYPWGGKRTTVRVHQQPKIVIRNPFHAWGGKRNQQHEIEG